MFIKDIFVKDINRNIQSVIKVSQSNPRTELEEYVITNEVFEYLNKFCKSYYHTWMDRNDGIGFLISGFYGSGKSHFLKILYYILKNVNIDILFKNNKCLEPISSIIHDVSNIPKDVIMFNIDSKNHKKESILDVFLNEFNGIRGFSPYHGFISAMEEQLHDEGKLDIFKNIFNSESGYEWEKVRGEFYLHRGSIINSISKVKDMGISECESYFESIEKNYKINIESFAKKVKEYIDKRGENYSVVFMVDEVSQFIAGDINKMLNLQTIIEELSTKCLGRAFVILTTHIDLLEDMRKLKYDFSKIQSRFKNRFHLSSINLSEVLTKRVLYKNSKGRQAIKNFYEDKKFFINTRLNFDFISNNFKGIINKEDFVNYYPFPPYQVDLLREVISYMIRNNVISNDISKGERNILSCFHKVIIEFKDNLLRHIVPFYMFYDAISDFIDYNHQYIFSILKDYTVLDEFDVNILKTLFLIKYVPNITADIDTLVSLMTFDICSENDMRSKVSNSLFKLINEGFVNRDGDKFYFLSKNERDINYKIMRNHISSYDIKYFLCSEMFSPRFNLSKFKYKNGSSFTLNQSLDDINYKVSNENLIGISIFTTNYDEGFNIDSIRVLSRVQNNVILYLNDDKSLIDEINIYLKLERFLKSIKGNYGEDFSKIIKEKEGELKSRIDRIRILIDDSIKNGEIFINGERYVKSCSEIDDLFRCAFYQLVECKFSKFSYINKSIGSFKKVFEVLPDPDLSMEIIKSNKLFMKELYDFIGSGEVFKLNSIITHFKSMPYGFSKIDILFGVLYLVYTDKVKCNHTFEDLKQILILRHSIALVTICFKDISDRKNFISYKELLEEVFNTKYFVDSFDQLFEKSKDDFKGVSDKIKVALEVSLEDDRYPDREFLFEFRDMVDSLKKGEFKDFDEVLSFFERFDFIYNFYTSVQVDIFNSGLKCLDIFYRDKNFLKEEGDIPNIKEIIKSESPYRSIVKLKSYVNKFMDFHSGELKSTKDKVIDFMDKELKDHIDSDLYDELKDRVIKSNTIFDVYGVKMEGIFIKDR